MWLAEWVRASLRLWIPWRDPHGSALGASWHPNWTSRSSKCLTDDQSAEGHDDTDNPRRSGMHRLNPGPTPWCAHQGLQRRKKRCLGSFNMEAWRLTPLLGSRNGLQLEIFRPKNLRDLGIFLKLCLILLMICHFPLQSVGCQQTLSTVIPYEYQPFLQLIPYGYHEPTISIN